MRKNISLYGVLAVVALSLQSCVSNYVATAPQYPVLPTLEVEKMEMEAVVMSQDEVEKEAIIVKAEDKEVLAAMEKKMKKANTIDGILNEASSYIGTPYRLGGMTRSGIDCSAFVLSVYGNAAGINLPRVSSAQAQEGEKVEKANLEKGDLLFFQTVGKRISHVGIVQDITPEGEIKFIHASSSKGVTISSLNEKYWGARYRFAKRILTDKENNTIN